MMTQILQPIDRPKHTEIDADHRGSGRNIFYGSSDPAKNLATQRARTLSPDEAYSFGFRDGLKSVQRGSMAENPNYTEGWSKGYALRQVLPAA